MEFLTKLLGIATAVAETTTTGGAVHSQHMRGGKIGHKKNPARSREFCD